MTNEEKRSKHATTLNLMLGKYSHIRQNDSEFDAIMYALDALREQAERDKGCDWCNAKAFERYGVDKVFGYPSVFVNCSKTPAEDKRFSFCPVCGKQLEASQ